MMIVRRMGTREHGLTDHGQCCGRGDSPVDYDSYDTSHAENGPSSAEQPSPEGLTCVTCEPCAPRPRKEIVRLKKEKNSIFDVRDVRAFQKRKKSHIFDVRVAADKSVMRRPGFSRHCSLLFQRATCRSNRKQRGYPLSPYPPSPSSQRMRGVEVNMSDAGCCTDKRLHLRPLRRLASRVLRHRYIVYCINTR